MNSFLFKSNLTKKDKDFLNVPYPQTYITSPITNIVHQNETLSKPMKAIMTHNYYPKSIIYI